MSQNCSPKFARERARMMFGCYRKSDAADPDTYVAALTMVLANYSEDVVAHVTHPVTGLPGRKTQSGWSGPPDIADVKEACDNEAAARFRRLEMAAKPKLVSLPPPPRKRGPGSRANVLILKEARLYPFAQRVTETESIEDWRHDENGRGIWISYALMQDNGRPAPKTFAPLPDVPPIESEGVEF